MNITETIRKALAEDIGSGDHTSLSTIPQDAYNKAIIKIKEDGILSGIEIAKEVFLQVDNSLEITVLAKDGDKVKYGDIVMTIHGKAISILTAERTALNFLQRMCGIATFTNQVVAQLEGLKTRVVDTRKTTPLLREFEKKAVRDGGGSNHRFGLYDMILIKDNHVDFSGGIANAINNCNKYLKENNLQLPVEIETRSIDEVKQVLAIGNVDRIMLDNFNFADLREAVKLINGKYETEASGGIKLETIRQYAECGVDLISIGALTHHIKSMDISLVAER